MRRLSRRVAVGAALASLVIGCGRSGDAGKGAAARGKQQTAPARITQFYASPQVIAAGEETLLCYGVENAAWVRLEPPVEQINPSLSRCITVKPAATTQYRLSVEGQEQLIEVKVTARKPAARAPHLIRLFVCDAKNAKPGQTITLCYGVLRTKSVRLDPGKQDLPVSDSRCVQQKVSATTRYELTAVGEDGSTETASVEVKVEP